jgi:hypothetical protein
LEDEVVVAGIVNICSNSLQDFGGVEMIGIEVIREGVWYQLADIEFIPAVTVS